MMDAKSQESMILHWMETIGPITGADAFTHGMGIRLPARICDMRRKGIPIGDRWCYKYGKDGKLEEKFKEYYLLKNERLLGMSDEDGDVSRDVSTSSGGMGA